MESLKLGILYLGLHNQLLKKFGSGAIIKRKEFFCKLGKHGQIPKNIRYLVIKEMEEKKLLELVNRDEIKILKIDIDIEKDSSKLFQLAGIY
jgi:hypothetical protein